MNVVTIVGARPQFVKTAVVSRALRAVPGVQEVLVHTGQHYDEAMSAVFFQELEIPQPDYFLEAGSGRHGAQTGRMLERIEDVLIMERPDWVLVYGDTNSTLAGALAAAKLAIPIAHVEAGLRSFNRYQPEEINRVLTDRLSDLLFPPNDDGVELLRREGISGDQVQKVGDVMYDVALYFGEKAQRESTILQRLGLAPKSYLLATVHRAENTDDPSRLRAIFGGLELLAAEEPVVVPLHPRTRAALAKAGIPAESLQNLRTIDPVGYLDMARLEQGARLIATDSGGIQKEAFFYRVPCVTLRAETEYTDLINLGWNHLFLPETMEALPEFVSTVPMSPPEPAENPYGDGKASERIAQALVNGRVRA